MAIALVKTAEKADSYASRWTACGDAQRICRALPYNKVLGCRFHRRRGTCDGGNSLRVRQSPL